MRPSPLLASSSWPPADRALWQALVAPAPGPLDDAGALSHLRPASLTIIATCYGRWLAWLTEALAEPPVCRCTPERLRDWTASMAHLSPMTRAMRLDGALRFLTAAAPDADWSVQRRLQARLRREGFRAHGGRKQGRILPSEILLQAGLDLAGPGADAAPTPFRAMIAQRDGLMVAFLALLPLRMATFSTLELGRSVLRVNGGWVIAVEGDRMKAGRPWEAPLPSVLVEPFTRYVDKVRPQLMARAKTPHQGLWVHHYGGPYDGEWLGVHIGNLTEALTGVRVPPHFFRDAAATTLVRTSPDAARLIRPLLAHADHRTAERHYVHAKDIEASRTYAELIAGLRDQAR